MATNLLDLAKQALPPSFTDMAAGLLGESPGATGSAIGSALPVLIAGVAQKGASAGGAQSVMALLDSPMVDTALLSNLGGMFSGANASATSVISSGASIVSSLFGDRAGPLGSALASMSGMRNAQSASSLVALLAPIVLAVIKRLMASPGAVATGLASLLSQQGPFLQGALDPRLAAALGFASPGALVSSIAAGAAGAAPALRGAAARGAAARGAAAREAAVVEASGAEASSWIGRWWPWMLAAIVILFLLYRCAGGERSAQNAVVPPVAPAVTPAPPPPPPRS